MMDLALKCQVAYNAAQISVIEQDFETAYKLFYESGIAAKNLGFSHGIFLSLTGIGHVATLTENWNMALSVLEQAETVVLEGDNPNYQSAYQVTKSILALKDILITKASQATRTTTLFDTLKKQVF